METGWRRWHEEIVHHSRSDRTTAYAAQEEASCPDGQAAPRSGQRSAEAHAAVGVRRGRRQGYLRAGADRCDAHRKGWHDAVP
eukprot:7371293-Prymnesium_polylepis.1